MWQVVWFALMLGPPLAIIAFYLLSRWQPNMLVRTATVAAIVVILIALFFIVGLTFNSRGNDVALLAIAYVAYCFLAVSLWRIRHIFLRIVAIVVAFVPIGLGYFLGTAGLLGLVFIVGDLTREPEKSEQMADGLTCRVMWWGSAGTNSGYTVGLYQSWHSLPVERRVSAILVDQTNGDPGVTCAGALKQYRG